jgi:5-methylcytosine-specific restriction protein A
MTQPVRLCPTPRCPNLQRCADHPRIPFANARRSTTLYSTARWKHESRAFLIANPFCVERQWGTFVSPECGAVATVVDHRIPHRGNEAAFWDRGNWAALCKPHHQAKTGREVRYRKGGLKRVR